MPLLYARGARPALPPQRIGQSFKAVNSSATLTIDYPTGSAPGDLILLQITASRTATGSITFSATGPTWTEISYNNHGTNSLVGQSFWAIRGAETSVTITMSPATSPSSIVAMMVAYLGGTVNATTPIGPTNTTSAVSSSVSSTALAGVGKNAEVVGLYWGWKSGAGTTWSTTWSGAGGAVKRDEQQAAGASYQILIAIGTAVQAAAGSFGVVTVAPASGSATARGLTMVAVNPVA